jgi:hypothetical protein
MTCVTCKAGNRHTTRHHQRESPAREPARQNRYTDPLHTASAERSHTTLTWVERNFGFATAQAYAGQEDHGRGGKAMATYIRAGLPEVATALAALTGEDHPLAISPAVRGGHRPPPGLPEVPT